MFPRFAVGVVAGAFVVGPLILAGAGGWPGSRSVVAELGSSLGIVSLGIFGLVLVLPSRVRLFERLGADVAVRLHRRLASGLLALVAAHVVVVVVAEPSRLRLFRIVGQPWRAQCAIGSTVVFGLLVLSSVGRRRLRLRYRTWRGLHLTLALVALALAVLHTIGWHRYLMTGVGTLGLGGVAGASLLAVAWLRVGRPGRFEPSSVRRGECRAGARAFRDGRAARRRAFRPPLPAGSVRVDQARRPAAQPRRASVLVLLQRDTAGSPEPSRSVPTRASAAPPSA